MRAAAVPEGIAGISLLFRGFDSGLAMGRGSDQGSGRAAIDAGGFAVGDNET